MRVPRMLVVATVVLSSRLLPAQTPTITATSPGAVRPGGTVDVTVSGSNLAGATSLWTSFDSTAVLAPGVKNNGKNASQVVFRVTVPATAPVGIHGLRVVTPNGVSPLRLFVLDDLPTVAQTANTTAATAQSLKLPVAVEGTVGALSKHYFQFDANAGQLLSFEVLARRIGSPLDPIFTLFAVTKDGPRELVYSDDAPGLFGDSRLSHRFEAAGQYLLELRDISYKGSANHRFRLRLGDFPCVSVPYPLGAKRGSETTLTFAGSSVENIEPVKVKVPAGSDARWLAVGAKRKGGQSSGFAVLAVSDSNEAVEREPNDEPNRATRVTLGDNLNGRFQRPGDVDRFVFSAKKGQRFTFNAITRRQGSPTDAVLKLLNAKGAKLVEADDSGMTDAAISYTFPADGDYQLVVQDLEGRGGPEFAYRIEVTAAVAPFSVSSAADVLNVPAGGTAAVNVVASRRGYNGPIQITVTGLPEGITAIPTAIGPGRLGATLTLVGTGKAKRGVAKSVRIVGTATIGKKTVTDVADINAALKALSAGYPFPAPTLRSELMAAVAPPAPFATAVEPQTVSIAKGKKATVKIKLTRGKGITEAVALSAPKAPRRDVKKLGLPPGLTVAVKPVPKGRNEVQLVISATARVPKGPFTIVLTATHKKGKATLTQSVPGILVQVK
jgi:hypothetical protein